MTSLFKGEEVRQKVTRGRGVVEMWRFHISRVVMIIPMESVMTFSLTKFCPKAVVCGVIYTD